MKKTILSLALAGAMLPAAAQQYKITGTAPQGAQKMYFANVESPRERDSVAVANGQFSFEGDAAGKMFGWVISEQGDRHAVLLDGNIELDFARHTVKGSDENQAMAPWVRSMLAYEDRYKAILAEAEPYGQNLPDTTRTRLLGLLEGLQGERLVELQRLFAENSDKLFPAYFLAYYNGDMEHEDVIRLLDAQPRYASLSLLDRLKGQVEGWRRQAVGAQFTDLALPDTAGVEHRLSEYVGKGKYVLVDFWASWCGPCMREMPNVKRAYERFHDKGFDIVGLSFDRDRKSWLGAIKRLNLPWHHLSDLKFWETEAAKVYGVMGIPLTLLIDPDGKIIANDLRGEALQKKLEEVLGN